MRCRQCGRCAKWVLSLSDDRHSHPIDAGILTEAMIAEAPKEQDHAHGAPGGGMGGMGGMDM
jgi:hypothetical protein